jgi:hypothetical protein
LVNTPVLNIPANQDSVDIHQQIGSGCRVTNCSWHDSSGEDDSDTYIPVSEKVGRLVEARRKEKRNPVRIQ